MSGRLDLLEEAQGVVIGYASGLGAAIQNALAPPPPIPAVNRASVGPVVEAVAAVVAAGQGDGDAEMVITLAEDPLEVRINRARKGPEGSGLLGDPGPILQNRRAGTGGGVVKCHRSMSVPWDRFNAYSVADLRGELAPRVCPVYISPNYLTVADLEVIIPMPLGLEEFVVESWNVFVGVITEFVGRTVERRASWEGLVTGHTHFSLSRSSEHAPILGWSSTGVFGGVEHRGAVFDMWVPDSFAHTASSRMLMCEEIDVLTELMVEVSMHHPFAVFTDAYGVPCGDPILVAQMERLWDESMGSISKWVDEETGFWSNPMAVRVEMPYVWWHREMHEWRHRVHSFPAAWSSFGPTSSEAMSSDQYRGGAMGEEDPLF